MSLRRLQNPGEVSAVRSLGRVPFAVRRRFVLRERGAGGGGQRDQVGVLAAAVVPGPWLRAAVGCVVSSLKQRR